MINEQIVSQLKEVKAKYLVDNAGKSMGDVNSLLEKEMEELRVKADPMNTGATGAGAEFVPTSVTLDKLVDLSRNKSTFLPALASGYQGANLAIVSELPLAGEYGNVRGAEEWTTGSVYANGTPIRRPATAKATITQKKLIYTAGISDKLQTFSIVDTLQWLGAGMSQQFLYDIEDIVLNADSTATSTGNINSDDQLATLTFADGSLDRRYIYDNGLRKQPINGSADVDYIDVGTLTSDILFELPGLMRSDVSPDQLVFVMDKGTYFGLMKLSDFKDMSIIGRQSTLTQFAITNIGGVDVYVTDNMRKTMADGKLSGATPASNTKGQIILAKRNVIQHGFGAPIKYQFIEDIEKGILFKAVQYFGFDNINKKAGITEPSIVAGINITL